MSPRKLLRTLFTRLRLRKKIEKTPENCRYRYISRVPSKRYKHTFDKQLSFQIARNACDCRLLKQIPNSQPQSTMFTLPIYVALRL